MESIWEKGISRPKFESLTKNINTEILIIGGGLTGILCAYTLKRAGMNSVLVEADEICNGITQNTTAKITVAHGLIYDKMIRRFGIEKAKLYLDAQRHACEEYETLCKEIDCDYEKKDSYVYTRNSPKKITKEVSALTHLGYPAEISSAESLPFSVASAVRMKDQAQFDPLKFAFAIAKDLPIYEHTKVVELLPYKAITKVGGISFKKLIIATHFPLLNKHGAYFLKMYQHRSYVLALERATDVNGMYVDESDRGLSFRNYKNLLLLGGGGHRTGKSGGCWHELEEIKNRYYKNATIIGKWATQDCMTLDGIPYIGQYSRNTPNIFVATGFNKWGITNSMVSAKILSKLMQGEDSPYSNVFSPSRSILRPQLAVNALESAVGLLTPTTPRCPHLGCALKYNAAEHSWDCPCHGSRFTETGELINNPATDDKEFK